MRWTNFGYQEVTTTAWGKSYHRIARPRSGNERFGPRRIEAGFVLPTLLSEGEDLEGRVWAPASVCKMKDQHGQKAADDRAKDGNPGVIPIAVALARNGKDGVH